MKSDKSNLNKFIKEEWFKYHIAEYNKISNEIDILEWRKPDTNVYGVTYIRKGNYLFVIGDIGEAIYCAGFDSFKKWADCDIKYFSNKCLASEKGRGYKEWNSDILKKEIKHILKEFPENGKTWKDFCNSQGNTATYSEQEWIAWLYDKGSEFFGPDPYCWPSDGKCIAARCRGHLIGLQIAIEQMSQIQKH